MKTITAVTTAIAAAGCLVAATPQSFAAEKQPAASRYYPLLGHWKGKGELAEPGQPAAKLALKLACRKDASGWAVRCDMSATNHEMTITEADLFGVDPVTGQGHWYAVTNQGDAHDHLTEWTDAATMKAHYEWVQDGKKMREDILFRLPGTKSMEFRSVVTADGKEAGVFSGKLGR
ncbi:MAG: hypothetical protein WCA09_01140 [Burkholderiales bacterium]